ncbi:MAG: hypothetical protein ACLTDR_05610 [Adlercreutzia equolifaciens]
MNNELFDRANERYRLRDYRGALMAFTECLQDTNFPLTPGEMGLLYHQIGNCLGEAEEPARGHPGLQPGHGRYGLPGAGPAV